MGWTISREPSEQPARIIKDLISADERFFEPMPEIAPEAAEGSRSTDHNYNDNTELVEAISKGARGAYWDILRKLRTG